MTVENLDQLERSAHGRCVALGTFDGVHIGHQAIFARLVKKAAEEDLGTAVVTFRNHPAAVVAPSRAPKLLTPWGTKRRLIARLGIGVVIGIDFDRALAGRSAEDFLSETLVAALQMKCMVAGPTLGFGAGRRGDVKMLAQLSRELGFGLDVVEKIDFGGRSVSSSAIRKLIEAGDLEAAAPLLGRDFSVEGSVARGTRRGHDIGFPTANLECDPEQMLPADGVYAAWAQVGDERLRAAVSVGPQPTFGVHDRLVEAHVIDYDADLYGEGIEIAFRRRLRPITRFASAEELAEQIAADIDEVRRILKAD